MQRLKWHLSPTLQWIRNWWLLSDASSPAMPADKDLAITNLTGDALTMKVLADLDIWCRHCRYQPLKKNQEAMKRGLTIYLLFSILNTIFVLLLYYLWLLSCASILLDTNRWVGMIIYLIYGISLILLLNVLIVICVIYFIMLLCTLLHSCLIPSIFGMKRDSPGNTILLGDFSHRFSLVFPDGADHTQHWDGHGLRARLV